MILHVVGDGAFSPEPQRAVEHEEFFVARICDTDVSSVYSFNPTSATKAQIEQMATGAVTFGVAHKHCRASSHGCTSVA